MGTEGSYSNNIEGIPLPGAESMPEVKGSAVPNRDDSATLSNPEGGEDVTYPVDYFDAMGSETGTTEPLESKDIQEKWSDGLQDEENDSGDASFAQLDDDWNEGAFPETQPFHMDVNQGETQND